jgi:large subunit ribosomal protein L9
MKIVLTQNVNNLGKKGEIKDVANGYANFLIKSKAGVMATVGMLKQLKIQKESEEKKLADKQKVYHEIVKQLKGINFISLTIGVGKEGGGAFEAINEKEIRNILKEKYSIDLGEEVEIDLGKIKEKGDYDITIKFPFGISSPLKLVVQEQIK